MYEDSIQELNKCFDDKENRSFDTGYNEDGEYSVSQYDVDDFLWLSKKKWTWFDVYKHQINGGGIWFTHEDLENAKYY